MSAACLETSVPAIPIAMPMAACWRAGASLTPSPVIAATSPKPCSCLMSRCLSCAAARKGGEGRGRRVGGEKSWGGRGNRAG
eukprot:4004557-Prymnesium_polylepis.1